MSGDSTFGISNTEAALSSSKDSDEADESVDDLSQKTSSQSDLSAAEVAKWRAEKEKRVKDLFATLKDDSLDQSVPEWPGTSRTSRWRQPRNQDGGGAARSSEHFNVSENNSIDAVEEQIRSRRRPFSNGQRRKSSAADVAAAFNDTTDDENAPVVYKKPLPFAKRRQTARKPSVPDPNAFNETHSSVEEEKPVRRTRGGFSKRPKSIPNPEFFDTTDESVVVEAKAKKFSRSARQVTEANMKAFEVTDDEEEEEEEDVGGEDERAKETRGGEDDKEGNRAKETRGEEDSEGKGTTEEDKGKENTVLEEEGGNGSEFVLELDEEGSVDKAEEEARNSMDESDESEAEEEGGNKSVSLVVQSEGEVGDEDSLGEDVDENGEEEEKEVDDEEGKQVVGSAKSGGKGDQDKVQQKNRDGGVGSSNEQSSLLLEYHLSVENQSVVIESHNKSSASLKSSASMTMDITLASRRSRSRRFTQQFLEMDKTGEGLPNLGKILDGVDVMNMSAKNLMEPIVGEALRISPLTEVAVSDKNDRSLRSRDNSAVSEKNNRSLRSRDDSGVSDRNNRSLRSGNRSVNKSNSGVSNENNKSLSSGNKPVVEKELNSSGKSGKKHSSAAKELFSDSSSGKDTSVQPLDQQEDEEVDRGERDVVATIDVINDSQRDEGGVGNRSLRNKRGRGDANKSVAEKDSSKENVESGDVSMEVGNNNSKLDEVDGVNRGLRDRSAAKRLLNTSVNEEQRGKNATDKEGSKENGGDVPNTSLRESNSRSLRNRSATKGKSNESLNEDQSLDDSMNFSVHDSLGFVTNAKKRASLNVSKGDLSIQDDNDSPIGASTSGRSLRDRSRNSNGKVSQGTDKDSDDVRSSNGARTYTSEEIVGFKQATQENSMMYNSLDSIRVDPLQLPQTDVNASAIVNNSLNSTVNATRADQNSSNRGLDEIMPAPRSLPARKRRLVAPTGGTPSFSLAAQKKKKKTAEGESDSVAALVEREKENDQVAVNGNREVVAAKVNYKCPKLKKPEVWVTPRLYKWLIEKLEPRYKLRSRLRAEEFVDLLCSTVKTVIKKEENYEKEVEDLKYEMARLNMVENLHEFFIFISEFLPWRFQDKSIPLPQAFITGKVVTYEKGTLYDPIL